MEQIKGVGWDRKGTFVRVFSIKNESKVKAR